MNVCGRLAMVLGMAAMLPSATKAQAVTTNQPPTLSCAAAPSAVAVGDKVTITSTANSPQNLALTYVYKASAGTITGDGATAELRTDGLASGSVITVSCAASDAHGLTATAETSVRVGTAAEAAPAAAEAPAAAAAATAPTTAAAPATAAPETEATPVAPTAAPEVAKAQALCTILFERDRKRTVRVDNEAKACLDSVALSKARESLSKLVLVGTYVHDESANAGAERALHAREYLVDEKGVDAGAIQTMVRASEHKSVENVLLPGDAVFEDNGAMEFDPLSVKLHGEAYGKHPGAGAVVRHKHHRKPTPQP